MPKTQFIPFHRPSIGEEEINEVVATLRSGWLTTGERTHRFEKEFRDYVGAAHSLALNSCTAALHLALEGLGIGIADEVITTPMTFCATVNAIQHTGATPVLADVGEDGNIDPASIEERITPRTKAIIPVHLAGLPCDMDAIWSIARRHGLYVVEDAAHACGAFYNGHPIGQSRTEPHSDAVAYSFYATKNLTTGEGGMVTTPHADLAARMKVLALHGISKDAWNRYSEHGDWFYDVVESGYKCNLSDIQSAIGIHQLHKLDGFIAERKRLVARYNDAFEEQPGLETPDETPSKRHAWHLYILKLNPDEVAINRADFIKLLRAQNIGTSVHFIPIPLHQFYALRAHLDPCPNAQRFYEGIVSLPLYPGLTDEQQDHVIAAVSSIARAHRRKIFAMSHVRLAG